MVARFHPYIQILFSTLLIFIGIQSGAYSNDCLSISSKGIVNLTEYNRYYIDLPPFEKLDQLDPNDFRLLEDLEESIDYNNIINKRYWVDIHLCNPSTSDYVKGYLYFGIFDRIFIYDHSISTNVPALQMGACYKSEALKKAPSNFHYPVELPPGSEAHLSVFLSNALFNTYVEDKTLGQFIAAADYPESLTQENLLFNKGLISIVLLTIVGFSALACLAYFIAYRHWSVLAFSQICFAIFLYFLRQAEYYFEINLFWGHFGEMMQQTEVLIRGYVMTSLMVYTLVTFNFGNRTNIVKFLVCTSVLIALFDGIVHFIKIDPWKHFTDFDNGLFLFNVLYMCLASMVILYYIWRQNAPRGRLYVYGTIIFVSLNYLSMLVVVQFPETNYEFLTGDMIVLYSTTIFLSFMAYITFIRSYKQQEEMVKSILYSQQLEEVNKAKSEFYTQVTHEFRTPITIINGIVKKLDIKEDTKKVILNNNHHLLKLVNQLLDRSQGNQGENIPRHLSQEYISNPMSHTAIRTLKNTDDDGNELPRVLVVEDNKDLSYYITSIIDAKYSILTASNGKQGLKVAHKEVPDIIITDIMMPIMNGIDMIEKLRDNMNTSHIPIIVLTAKADYDSKLEGLKIGADAYLIKPFDEDELLVRIKAILENRRKLQRHYAETEELQLGAKEDTFLTMVKSCIEKNIANESFGIKQICEEVHLERTQLYRKVKALTGTTPSELIKQMRMQKAWKMLKTHSYQIYEVAYACGFKEASYFSKVFKEHYGCQPSDVRNK